MALTSKHFPIEREPIIFLNSVSNSVAYQYCHSHDLFKRMYSKYFVKLGQRRNKELKFDIKFELRTLESLFSDTFFLKIRFILISAIFSLISEVRWVSEI